MAVLSACGGGGGSSDTPAPTAATLTLSGTAATGKAVAGGAVDAKCSGGSGTATTLSSGNYSLSISGASLPCVVRVTAADGTVLHSAASGSGSSATVNISPLTELIVAQAVGGTAASAYASFDAAMQGRLGAASVASATAAVATALRSVVDIGSANPIQDALVAATGSTAGNALDQKLDALAQALAAAQVSVAELSSVLVANAGAAATVVASQLKPAAGTCASLRSGDYRQVTPNEGGTSLGSRKFTVDATTLTVSENGVSVGSVTPVAGRACEFTIDGSGDRFVVSPAGVVVQRYLSTDGNNQPRVKLAFPEQTIALADLAGTWSTVEFNKGDTGTSLASGYSVATVDSTGHITAGKDCQYLQPCTDATPNFPPAFTINPAGGFDTVNSDGSVGRFFAYRSPSGDLMLVGGDSTGLIVGTRQKALALPTVGDATPFWNLSVNGSGTASALTYDISTIGSVDTAAGTYTRTTSSDGRVDTFAVNSPRAGMRYRAVNGCKTSTGAAGTCSGIILLPLQGMGMAVFGSSVNTNALYGFSVNRPAGSTGTGTAGSSSSSAAVGTLVVNGGETYPLRMGLTVSAAGVVTGGQYDWHKLAGTMTPCTYSPALQSSCFGTSGLVGNISQAGAIAAAGANGATLSIGPDVYGYRFTGSFSGTTWSGTWTKAATAIAGGTQSGSFSVVVSITQAN